MGVNCSDGPIACGLLPFLMDLRDPWSVINDLTEHEASPSWYWMAERFERKCVAESACVVMNTEPAAAVMRGRYPGRRVEAVMNGFDGDPIPPARHGPTFQIIFAGAIYMDREPRGMLQALRTVAETRGLGPDRIRLRFIGPTEAVIVERLRKAAEDMGVGHLVSVEPSMPRHQLFETLVEAAVLLNLPQAAVLCLPSKLFEYVHLPAWILALEPAGSAAEQFLRGTGADVVPRDDVAAITAALARRYDAYARGERPAPSAAAGAFTRAEQFEKMFALIQGVVRPNSQAESSPRR